VMCGVRAIDDSILFEGLARHAWDDAQLHHMEAALATADMLAVTVNCYRMERADFLQTTLYVQRNDITLPYGYDDRVASINLLLHGRPKGWWDLDRRADSRANQDLIDAIDLTRRTVRPPTDPLPESEVAKLVNVIAMPLTTIAFPVIANGVAKAARAEADVRLARLALRLEEYRLAHGQYPEELTNLPDLPPHLNQEVLNEDPLRYWRKGEGYLLYSTGWNQKDDGGVLDADPKQGDWVWPSP